MRRPRKIVALDFDGVLHMNDSGSDGPEPVDAPVPHAKRMVAALLDDGYGVVVFSHRATTPAGMAGIRTWLSDHDFPPMPVVAKKPAADVYVDDRALRFNGNVDEVLQFVGSEEAEPWNKPS